MHDIKNEGTEKVILMGIYNFKLPKKVVIENLDELELLCKTAGASVEKVFVQNVPVMNPTYLIGKGKAEEIALFVSENSISAIIFDDELTPTQIRNLEKITNCKILDRSTVILDIFAAHAKTREAKTQVELAQYEYFLTRLTRAWTHFSKQYGGIGTKGPGETQIETDRRIIRDKIAILKDKLSQIDIQRDIQRKGRNDIFKIALVGYTNVGKSTLLNLLTGADVLIEDKLFATLDSTTRSYKLSNKMNCLITDTVGFIKKLPHSLIASFRSTLKEVTDADLILHIADASHRNYEEQIAVVNDTLSEINVNSEKVLLVFNKIDLQHPDHLHALYPDAVFISSARGINIIALEEKIIQFLKEELFEKKISLKVNESKKINQIKELSEKIEVTYLATKINIIATVKKSNLKKLLQLIEKNEN